MRTMTCNAPLVHNEPVPPSPFTLLMAVYGGDDPGLLIRALSSVFPNTLHPDSVVLVADGPLTEELDTVIERKQSLYANLRVHKLTRNCGLTFALNEGINLVDTKRCLSKKM